MAKAITNGAQPMGAVAAKTEIYDTITNAGPAKGVEFFHGYTYSAHPLAVAAAHATLDELAERDLIGRAAKLAPVLEDAIHSLKGEPLVTDIRNLGLAAAVDVSPVPGKPALRAFQVFEQALARGLMLRFTGETLALAPPFISTEDEVRGAVETLRTALRAVPA